MLIHRVLSRLKQKIWKDRTEGKRRTEVVLTRPAYYNRHQGRNAMVLGTGASIWDYEKQIKAFVRENDCVVLGVNGIREFMAPQYHGFTNRRRLAQFGLSVDPEKSRALVSAYFTDHQIRTYCKAPYDIIMWRDAADPSKCSIDEQGIINFRGLSGSLMIMVAYAMGCRQIFVAGMDGFSESIGGQGTARYVAYDYRPGYSEIQKRARLREWQLTQEACLASIAAWSRGAGRNLFVFVTPGDFSQYYRGLL